jgi:hypothetical protein
MPNIGSPLRNSPMRVPGRHPEIKDWCADRVDTHTYSALALAAELCHDPVAGKVRWMRLRMAVSAWSAAVTGSKFPTVLYRYVQQFEERQYGLETVAS